MNPDKLHQISSMLYATQISDIELLYYFHSFQFQAFTLPSQEQIPNSNENYQNPHERSVLKLFKRDHL